MDAPDPLQTEIHRKAIENIVNEMAVTLSRTSGSPIVTDSKDFSTCVLDTAGEQLALSSYVLLHSSTALLNTAAVLEQLDENGAEPHPGDGWVVNDPYAAGSAHQGDVGIVTPVFYRGQHVAWAFSNLHVLDIGGMAVSGVAPTAVSVYDEALRFPAIRMIRNGKLDEDWQRYLVANVRTPIPVLNDIRSMIAANNVAEIKLAAVIDRFGLEAHRRYNERNIQLTEELLRRRIDAMPDGRYEAVEYLEFEGRGRDDLIEIRCTMEVAGSDLRFFLTGDPQYDGPGNGTKGSVYGGVMTQIMTMLGYGDLPFNAGMWRPLLIDIGPEGTVVNAQPPAPVSMGHAEAGCRVGKAVRHTLNQAASLSRDPGLRRRAAGLASEASATAFLYGKGPGGAPALLAYLETSVGTGGGAQIGVDGQDMYGHYSVAGGKVPDVEVHEATDPVLFLWRRIALNSGGPGQWRGGQGLDQAYVLTGDATFSGFANMSCVEFPPPGFGGGYPPLASEQYPIRGAQFAGLALAEEAIGGTREIIGKKVFPFELNPRDVLRHICGGGGGLGDPLHRSPAYVARDLEDGYITDDHAKAGYGVIVGPDRVVDVLGTERLRAALRYERLGDTPAREGVAPDVPGVVIEASEKDDGSWWTCGYCDVALARAEDDWRNATVQRELPLGEFFASMGMRSEVRHGGSRVNVICYYCAECASALSIDVATKRRQVMAPVIRQSTEERSEFEL